MSVCVLRCCTVQSGDTDRRFRGADCLHHQRNLKHLVLSYSVLPCQDTALNCSQATADIVDAR
jgi:hypothetical protein